ncbi:MAG TPA: phospholipase D-like domain-containing protein [Gemmatimonadaceae bacterium]|nr:phospholipase D-like domain-containing protein [Gemmatimonadaceae bacterium]
MLRSIKRLSVVLGVVIVLAFALIGVLTVTRGSPLHRVLAPGDERTPSVQDSLFVRTLELFAGLRIEPGNKVEVLANGATYPRLWEDIRSARQTLTVQMYFSKPGVVADSMAKYLIDRARAKVRVLVLLDAFGSQGLEGPWTDSLKRAGVEVAWLRPLRWYTLHKAAQRSHVRVVVVDGRVGYTGGFGLADYWLGNGHEEDQWRESNARFEGPSVAQLQATFAAGWAEATGQLITGDVFFPPPSFAEVGTVAAGVLHFTPTIGSTPAERFLALSITGARRTLYISNSYFVPDDDFRELLVRAAKRGVDVRVLTAGDRSDVKTTLYAGRARYQELLEGGVRIYEYQPTMMHAKTLVADGVWSTVGSLNFDNRSLVFNNESNIVALNGQMGATLDSLFMSDLGYAKEIKLAEFARRSVMEKLIEWGANALQRVL